MAILPHAIVFFTKPFNDEALSDAIQVAIEHDRTKRSTARKSVNWNAAIGDCPPENVK